mmetsp:Transcript_125711/g.363671  ORF Transcript_125711/g.363671 Transcript_125711/m.363671 type:complete len:800 (+) Transcript_125711:104-2503(+)
MSSIAELRYSDVATYVGLSLRERPAAARRHIRQKVSNSAPVVVLSPSCPGACSSTPPKQESRSRELPPIAASQADRLKAHLRLLQAEQVIQREQVKKLEVSLSDSRLVEKKARERTAKHRELHGHHKNRYAAIEKEIARLRGELGGDVDVASLSTGAAPDGSAVPAACAVFAEAVAVPCALAERPTSPAVIMPAAEPTTAVEKDFGPRKPSLASSSGGRSGGRSPGHLPALGRSEKEIPEPMAAESAGEDAALGRDCDEGAPDVGEIASADDAGGEAEQMDHTSGSEGTELSDGSEAGLSADDLDPSATLRPDEAAHAAERGMAPAVSQATAAPASAAPQSAVKFRAEVAEQGEESGSDDEAGDLAKLLRAVAGKSEADLPKEDRTELARLRREVIRNKMIKKAGSARQAFRFLDLNGSGSISHQEFAEGVRRLGVEWPAITGLKHERHFFKLFDRDHDHVIIFRELFPQQAAEERAGMTRVPTPDFCRKYNREKKQVLRQAGWQPKDPEEKLTILTGAVERQDESAHRRKWISATMRRLKGKGKSDARCRELVALHLPRGSGPRDLQGVHTFSKVDLRTVRQTYADEWNTPVRQATRTMVDLRELRREQKQVIEKLYKVTEAEYARQRAEEKAATGLGMALFGELKAPMAGNKAAATEAPAAVPSRLNPADFGSATGVKGQKAVSQLAKELGFDETQLSDIQSEYLKCTESNSKLIYKGFARLLKALAPSRTLAESDLKAWWAQALSYGQDEGDTSRAVEESKQDGAHATGGGKQQCDFEQFAMWYALCELRAKPPSA